jgi:hypothetical protein
MKAEFLDANQAVLLAAADEARQFVMAENMQSVEVSGMGLDNAVITVGAVTVEGFQEAMVSAEEVEEEYAPEEYEAHVRRINAGIVHKAVLSAAAVAQNIEFNYIDHGVESEVLPINGSWLHSIRRVFVYEDDTPVELRVVRTGLRDIQEIADAETLSIEMRADGTNEKMRVELLDRLVVDVGRTVAIDEVKRDDYLNDLRTLGLNSLFGIITSGSTIPDIVGDARSELIRSVLGSDLEDPEGLLSWVESQIEVAEMQRSINKSTGLDLPSFDDTLRISGILGRVNQAG